MQSSSFIQERSLIIPIPKNLTSQMKTQQYKSDEYSLKQNFFDPTKSSPPNNFMLKLYERMSVYK
jgi:hypothetical protein